MKPIVVPVNFSPASVNAARYAADLALAVGGKIHLIHILQLPFTAADFPMPDAAFEAMREDNVNQLKALAAELESRTRGGVEVDTFIEWGGVEYKLEKYCLELTPFLVVMGASGSPLNRFVSGSDTMRALRGLPYPLLIIPDNAAFHGVKKIVLACDLEGIGSGIGVKPAFLQQLKDLFGSSFDVLNVSTHSEENRGRAVFEFESWKSRLQELYPELHFIRTDKVSEGIHEYLEGHPADWLMVFPKNHAFYELHSSEARKIVLHSAIPVISIHE